MSKAKATGKAKSMPKKVFGVGEFPPVFPNAGALDIGASEIIAAVLPERSARPVRAFSTYTEDLHRLVEWMVTCGVDTVAMESTGVYWVAVYELLEAAGIEAVLVNARHVKMVPGRKSDWNDAQWLQKLHSAGLLRGSFRPDAEMVVLRTLLRHRAELIEHRSPHVLHMQKALKLMNIQLSEVLTDVVGVSGQRVLRAIVSGERDAKKLASLRHGRCETPEEEIVKGLTGNWTDEQIFILKQSLNLYDFYTEKVAECDRKLEEVLQAIPPRFEVEEKTPLPNAKPGSKSKNKPSYDARSFVYGLTGVDLVAVMGISAALAQVIVSEIGTDMSRFPTVKHFCSWLGLAPRNDISGGRVLRSRTLKVRSRAGQAFRQAAQSVSRSDSAFGAFYRMMRARLGPQQATVATAHKIARAVYFMLQTKTPYRGQTAEEYQRERRERDLKHLVRRAKKLGCAVVSEETGELVNIP